MGDKNIEIRCLEKVIKYSKSQHGESKRIIDLLKGKDVERSFDERPDFVKISKYKGNDVLVGIEHFQIDGFSNKNKYGKYAGSTIKHENDVKRIFEKYHKDIIHDHNKMVLNNSMQEVTEHICDSLKYSELKTYVQFISNFDEKLSNHIKNADIYFKSVKNLNNNNLPIKMIVLIEVKNDFSGMFINEGKNTKKLTENVVPLFLDIVYLLETIDSKNFDYIILSLGGDIHKQPNIIAIPTGNVRNHLQKRNIKVYNYFGYDRFLPEDLSKWKDLSINSLIKNNSDEFNIDFKFSGDILNVSARMSLMFCGYYLSYNARKIKSNFINDSIVQLLLDVYTEYLIDWHFIEHDDIYLIKPLFVVDDNELLNKKIEEFKIKWDLIPKNEDEND